MRVIDANFLPAEPLRALRELSQAGTELESLLRERVVEARRDGATWDQIGESLGMSRQAAWEYYTRDVRKVLDRVTSAGEELSDDEALRIATEEVSELRRRRRRGA